MKDFFCIIKEYWFLILVLVSLIVGWSNFDSRLSSAEEDINDLKVYIEKSSETNSKINERLGKMETSIDFIKNRVK